MVLTRKSDSNTIKNNYINNKETTNDNLIEVLTIITYEDWIKQGKPNLSDWSKIIF